MKNLKICIASIIALFTTTISTSQDKQVLISVDTLSSNVYMLTGQGGNIGIYIGTESVFMIDDQFARLSDQLKNTISRLSKKPISFLFNTHMHGDHTGGNANFNNSFTTIVAHDNVRKSLEERLTTNSNLSTEILPEVSFSDDITFYDGDETIMAFHVHNAHTDGDAMVYFLNNNVLHMGDTYFSGRYPYIDLKSGGSVNGYIEAQKEALLLINEDTVIIPGHGKPSNKKELETYVLILEEIKQKILNEINAGKTLEEVVANKELLSAYDESYGQAFIGPERIRKIFYQSLSK